MIVAQQEFRHIEHNNTSNKAIKAANGAHDVVWRGDNLQ